MTLSKRQQEVKDSMEAGKWYTTYELQTNVTTMKKLMRGKLVEREEIRDISDHRMRDSGICCAHSYRLRGAG